MDKLIRFVDYAGKNWQSRWTRMILCVIAAALILTAVWYGGEWIQAAFGGGEEAAAAVMGDTPFLEKECWLTAEYDCSDILYGETGQWELLREIAAGMGLREPIETQEVATEAGTSFSLIKTGAYSEMTIKMVTLAASGGAAFDIKTMEQEQQEAIQYLFVSLRLTGNYEDILYYRRLCGQTLQQIGLETDVNLEFKGTLPYLKEAEIEELKQRFLKALRAEIVSENDSGATDIIYAYSPLVQNVIESAAGKINVNIIIKQKPEQDRTEIRIAIPAALVV